MTRHKLILDCDPGVDDAMALYFALAHPDIELLGIPHRVVIGERGLADGALEYRARRAAANEALPLAHAAEALLARVRAGIARHSP